MISKISLTACPEVIPCLPSLRAREIKAQPLLPFSVSGYQVLATPRGLFCSLVSNETGFNSNSALSTQKATKNINESPQLPLRVPEWSRRESRDGERKKMHGSEEQANEE